MSTITPDLLVNKLRHLAGEPHRFDGHNEVGVAMLQAVDALEAAKVAQPVVPQEYCMFPDCKCPMDPGPAIHWCAKGRPPRTVSAVEPVQRWCSCIECIGDQPDGPAVELPVVADVILQALKNYRCIEHVEEDDETSGMRLVDLLTHGSDIGPGLHELDRLSDHIADAISDAKAAIAAQGKPVHWEESQK